MKRAGCHAQNVSRRQFVLGIRVGLGLLFLALKLIRSVRIERSEQSSRAIPVSADVAK
jgi:hypothetical protein